VTALQKSWRADGRFQLPDFSVGDSAGIDRHFEVVATSRAENRAILAPAGRPQSPGRWPYCGACDFVSAVRYFICKHLKLLKLTQKTFGENAVLSTIVQHADFHTMRTEQLK
jgi:hypothetical protein